MAEYEPLIIDSAQGCTLADIDGRRYLDGVSSLWCNVHGHRHPRLDAALRLQLEQVAHTTNLGASNPTTIRLAKRLTQIAPPGLSHVFFSDDGATAVEVAIKIAFQYWRQRSDPRPEKTRFVALEAAYHGDTIGSVSVGGIDRFHRLFKPLLFDALRVPAPDLYRLPANVTAESALAHYLGHVEAVLAEHHRTIAALVMEPLVQGAAGMIVHPSGFLAGVRDLTRRYGVLLILDEVAVGFGRTGKMFACEHEAVSPDLLCLAKGLTGGYLPMAATLATDELWNAFLGEFHESKTLFHGHTYGGNPLAAAVALASLDVFDEERTLENLPPKIARLADHLERLAHKTHVGNVRQCGLIGAVALVQVKESKTPFPWQAHTGHRVCLAARRHGVLLRPLGDVIVIMPPLAISHDEIDQIARAVELSIDEVCGAT
jgi:adenosylmethionine-8-amino-7-oxononanoate aminotransferase